MLNDHVGPQSFLKGQTAITRSELEEFGVLLYERVGITLGPSKEHMVSARVRKRMRALDMDSFAEYLRYLHSPNGRVNEFDEFIDVMTTNKTEFFREIRHYDLLLEEVVPALRSAMPASGDFLIWSAGCATGEEPYSLAMALYEPFIGVSQSYSVFASDICKAALGAARQAVYEDESVAHVPATLVSRFFLRGKGKHEGSYRVAPEIRDRVTFQRLNLISDSFNFQEPFHAIWCRNVMIYFDAETIAALCRKFLAALCPGGYLFVGHSESLNGVCNDFAPVAPAVYRKRAGAGR
jgi:chemotaxis protein methyltransferase CheR